MFLKQVKIKTRLMILCLLPAAVVSVGAYLILEHLSQNLHGYQVAGEKIALIDDSLVLNNEVYRYFAQKLESEQGAETNIESIQQAAKQVLDEEEQESKLVSQSAIINSFKELKYFINNINDIDSESVYDSEQLWFVLMDDILTSVNKIKITNGDSDLFYVNENFEYLSWFLYWIQKESWLIQSIQHQEHISDDIRKEYIDVISRQKTYWNIFVNYAATDKQLHEINRLLSKSSFQKFRNYHTELIDGNINSEMLSEGVKVYSEKVSSLLSLFSGYSKQASNDIKKQIEIANQQILITRMVVVLILILLIFISIGTFYRVSGNLTRILNVMRKLRNNTEGKKNNSDVELIKITGNDELSQFAFGLNAIITQLSEHEKRLIDAKEEAIKANKAKSVFLANISHEIRTPLNGIVGLTEILTMQNLNAAQKNIVEDIEVSSQTLLVLINDILDLSKIESGKLSIAPTLCNIRKVVYNTVNLVSTNALTQLNELHIDIDNSVPIHVNCDVLRYKQILMNLLSNAVKFTREGYVQTSLSYNESRQTLKCTVKDTGIGIANTNLDEIFKPFHQGDSTITRRFGGTGLGLTICKQLVDLMGGEIVVESHEGKGSEFTFFIPVALPKEQKKTEPLNSNLILITNNSPYVEQIERECEFYSITLDRMNSVDELTCRGQPLSNDCILYCSNVAKNDIAEINKLKILNPNMSVIAMQHHLFINRELVNLVDGNVVLPFMGNKFVSILKNQLSNKSKDAYQHESGLKVSSKNMLPSSKRVLIVEDNLMNQKIAGFFLDKIDLEYTVVNNGQEALDTIFHGTEYAAILMDCMMPIMDGLTATKRIREWEKQNNKVPVPIIALTASVLDEDVVKCFESGMDAYLPKPYKSEQLYEIFDRFKINQWS